MVGSLRDANPKYSPFIGNILDLHPHRTESMSDRVVNPIRGLPSSIVVDMIEIIIKVFQNQHVLQKIKRVEKIKLLPLSFLN